MRYIMIVVFVLLISSCKGVKEDKRILDSRIQVCGNDRILNNRKFVIVNHPVSGQSVTSGFTVTGCSRTFNAYVPWELYSESGNLLASGTATGGGVIGYEPFSFSVVYEVVAPQLGHMRIYEFDESKGRGWPPKHNFIPVILR